MSGYKFENITKNIGVDYAKEVSSRIHYVNSLRLFTI